MRTLGGLRRHLGLKATLHYLRDYHQSRIDVNGTWQQAVDTLDWYGPQDDAKIVEHARFMDSCGSDLDKYRRYNSN